MAGIGNLVIKLTADMAQFAPQMARAGSSVQRLERQVAAMGRMMRTAFAAVGAAVGGLVAAIGARRLILALDDTAARVDALGKAARRLGLAASDLSALRFAAEEAGVEFSRLESAIGKAGKNIATLVRSGSRTAWIGRLQVQLTGADGQVRSLTDLLPELARGIESAGSAAEQLRLSEQFFGREGGAAFVNMLRETGGFVANLAVQTERARRLNAIIDDETVRRLTDYRDALGRVGTALRGLGTIIMRDVAPHLTTFLNGLASAIAAIPDIATHLVAVFRELPRNPALRAELATLAINVAHAFGEAGRLAGLMWGAWFLQSFGTLHITLGAEIEHLTKPLALGMRAAMMRAKWAVGLMGDDEFQEAATRIVRDLKDIEDTSHRVITRFVADMNAANMTFADAAIEEGVRQLKTEFIALGLGAERVFKVLELWRARSMQIGTAVTNAGEDAKEVLSDLETRLAAFGEEGQKAIEALAGRVSDAFAEMLIDGKNTFGELARSFAKMMVSMALQAMIFKPLFDALGANFGTWFGATPATKPDARAHGGAFDRGRVLPFASGGVVSAPTLFPMARGVGLMGEAGPEAIMPLARIRGELGVRAGGGGGVQVNIIDQRQGGSPVSVRERAGVGGQRTIDVIIRDAVRGLLADGSLDSQMGTSYGLQRRGATR